MSIEPGDVGASVGVRIYPTGDMAATLAHERARRDALGLRQHDPRHPRGVFDASEAAIEEADELDLAA